MWIIINISRLTFEARRLFNIYFLLSFYCFFFDIVNEKSERKLLNMLSSYYNDVEKSQEYEDAEVKALKKDLQFEKGFKELENLSDQINNLCREFNLGLKDLKNNPPDDTFMPKWHELQDLKPYPVNDY